MIATCTGCGHELWSEVRKAGAFRFVAHFDDDERSGTYAEHTPFCPGCGGRLDLGISGPTADDAHSAPRGLHPSGHLSLRGVYGTGYVR